MKNEEFATAIVVLRRTAITILLLFNAVANSSLFILHSSLTNSSLFILHSSLTNSSLLYAQTQRGKASFYAKRATGARTASGERLHHDSMTCAHRTLSFGTHLRVTHQGNGRSVVVKVNDRGPYVRGRIVDLSWGAARELGMIAQGIANVVIEVVDDDITIPLRPTREHRIELPKLSIDPIEMADTLKPIWQEELLIDHQKVQRHMESTARKSLLERIENYFKH